MKSMYKLVLFSAILISPLFTKAQNGFSDLLNMQDAFACDSFINEDWSGSAWMFRGSMVYQQDANGYISQVRSYNAMGDLGAYYQISRDANNKVDTVRIFFDLGSGFIMYSEAALSYNANGTLKEELRWQYNFGTGQTVLDERVTYTYDANDNRTVILTESYDNGSWVNNYRYTYTYNASNQVILVLEEGWDDVNNIWLNNSRETPTYNAQGKKIESVMEKWNFNNSTWENEWRQTRSYDPNDNWSATIGQGWNGSAWVNSELDTTFTVNGKFAGTNYYEWDGSAWVRHNRSTCDAVAPPPPTVPNDPSNLVVNPTNKKSEAKMHLTWDDNSDNEDGFIVFRTQDTNFAWVRVDTVDANVTEYTDSMLNWGTTYFYQVQAFNSVGTSWFSNIAYATTLVSVQEKPEVANVYPNPSNGVFTIHLKGAAAGEAKVSIVSNTGQIVYEGTTQMDERATIPVKLYGVSAGIYFVKISAGDKYYSGKLQVK